MEVRCRWEREVEVEAEAALEAGIQQQDGREAHVTDRDVFGKAVIPRNAYGCG